MWRALRYGIALKTPQAIQRLGFAAVAAGGLLFATVSAHTSQQQPFNINLPQSMLRRYWLKDNETLEKGFPRVQIVLVGHAGSLRQEIAHGHPIALGPAPSSHEGRSLAEIGRVELGLTSLLLTRDCEDWDETQRWEMTIRLKGRWDFSLPLEPPGWFTRGSYAWHFGQHWRKPHALVVYAQNGHLSRSQVWLQEHCRKDHIPFFVLTDDGFESRRRLLADVEETIDETVGSRCYHDEREKLLREARNEGAARLVAEYQRGFNAGKIKGEEECESRHLLPSEQQRIRPPPPPRRPPPPPPRPSAPLASEPPEELLCPISLSLFEDPVVTPYGHSYERRFIEQALKIRPVDPLTGQPLTIDELRPNRALRDAADRFRRSGR